MEKEKNGEGDHGPTKDDGHGDGALCGSALSWARIVKQEMRQEKTTKAVRL